MRADLRELLAQAAQRIKETPPPPEEAPRLPDFSYDPYPEDWELLAAFDICHTALGVSRLLGIPRETARRRLKRLGCALPPRGGPCRDAGWDAVREGER